LLSKGKLREALTYLAQEYIDTGDARIAWCAAELACLLEDDELAVVILERIENYLAVAKFRLAEMLEKRGLIDDAIKRLLSIRECLSSVQYSFVLQAMLKSPTISSRDLLVEHGLWARKFCPVREPGCRDIPCAPRDGRKIRIGYHCSFWNNDTIRNQLLPVLKRHDKGSFEIYAYSPHELDACYANVCKEIRITGDLDDEQFARLVRQDGIDVFLECTGFSPGHRFQAMAARCAPVQVSYLNHSGTSGTPNVDYVLADDVSLPRDEDAFYTERVYRLPGCFFCFNFEDSFQPQPGAAPVTKNGYVTYGCFGSHGKINEILIDWWADILKAVPDSRLYVRNLELSRESNRSFFLRQMGDRGIQQFRLAVRGGLPRNELVSCYQDVDISLDTWPYNGGNTIAESLWQGVPVISYKGQRFSSSYGASLLVSSGCPELVAGSPSDYVRLAVELAKSQERILLYRRDLRERTRTSGFNNAAAFAHKLEGAFLSMLREKATSVREQ
jgi:predicted O-linked N-acetylglucosamine transferase (SPINDLY family)